ncbi:MAG: hypothetical protein K7J46_17435 [Bryobacter sp.]|jgi:hypothetical protein|nr:hypothetical protein [Bryobacter sp. CoA8 C33]
MDLPFLNACANSTSPSASKLNALVISVGYSHLEKFTYDAEITWRSSALVILSELREMFFLVVLSIATAALFAYWFRYSCHLILRTRTAENFGERVSLAKGLSFDHVKVEIERTTDHDLERLYFSLDKDYRVMTRLLGDDAAEMPQESRWEMSLLRANFSLTRCHFLLSRKLGIGDARQALAEMSETVEHFANSFGEQTSLRAMAWDCQGKIDSGASRAQMRGAHSSPF